MIFECFHGVVEIILASNCQQNSFARQIEQGAMQGLKSGTGIFGADFDSGQAILADDASPERVVEIYDETFGGATCERYEKSQPLARHVEQMVSGDGKAGHLPFALVAPVCT